MIFSSLTYDPGHGKNSAVLDAEHETVPFSKSSHSQQILASLICYMETPWIYPVTTCQFTMPEVIESYKVKKTNSLGITSWICKSLLSLFLNSKYKCTDFSRSHLLQQQRKPLGKLRASGETKELAVLWCVLWAPCLNLSAAAGVSAVTTHFLCNWWKRRLKLQIKRNSLQVWVSSDLSNVIFTSAVLYVNKTRVLFKQNYFGFLKVKPKWKLGTETEYSS